MNAPGTTATARSVAREAAPVGIREAAPIGIGEATAATVREATPSPAGEAASPAVAEAATRRIPHALPRARRLDRHGIRPRVPLVVLPMLPRRPGPRHDHVPLAREKPGRFVLSEAAAGAPRAVGVPRLADRGPGRGRRGTDGGARVPGREGGRGCLVRRWCIVLSVHGDGPSLDVMRNHIRDLCHQRRDLL
ncbi:hypothetical protein CSUB01_09796 [Colletotrichum sublineola]|uniref:Uncharacterized protein n=1 Tax=Colletotrichum sublineola TaxID=1173701 RepID=A0A066XL19_COLSU|nr:hypothetical protein CSUB01_09796 [Colletotrichum sublineola]